MSQSKRLIVGLGNPGAEYADTRHNIGFRVIDALSERMKLGLKKKGEILIGWGNWRGRGVGLAKPQTFMNRSGLAVEKLVRKNSLNPQDILVVVDDINLEPGRIRIREKGGPGGHNGLEDIIDWLDSDAFPRLRLGIGSGFQRGRQADYVLSPFASDEIPLMEEAMALATDAALTFVTDGIATAMNRYSK